MRDAWGASEVPGMGRSSGQNNHRQEEVEEEGDIPNMVPVRVAVRVRPLAPEEEVRACTPCISIQGGRQINLGSKRSFTFDVVYDNECSQEELFEHSVCDLVDGVLDGYNATVLAYGQTGSGKTYTMGMSSAAARIARDDIDADSVQFSDNLGLVPRVCSMLFDRISQAPPGVKYVVKMTYLEIYNENVRDLLDTSSTKKGRKSLSIRDASSASGSGGVLVQGAEEVVVTNVSEVFEQVEIGAVYRATGSTQMNAKSSRSHAILTLVVEQHVVNSRSVRTAKFHLVDLAGSERNKRTGAVGERFQESIRINQGLLALGNVISILGDESRRVDGHVPYRQSKLTRLLRDSLGGNSRTLFIACVSPADESFAETLNTLKYANRARNIRNMPIVVERDVEEERRVRDLEEQIESLMHDKQQQEGPIRNIRSDILRLVEDAKLTNSPEQGLRGLQLGLQQLLNYDQRQLGIEASPGRVTGECASEECRATIQNLETEVREARADLERDEVIFASRMEELKNVRKQLEVVHDDREQLRLRLLELEEENEQLLNDSPVKTPGSVVSAFGGKILTSSSSRCPYVSPIPKLKLAQMEAEVSRKDQEIAEMNSHITNLREQLDKVGHVYNSQIITLKEDLKQANRDLDTSKRELDSLTSERDFVVSQCNQKDEEIRSLQSCRKEAKPISLDENNLFRQVQTRIEELVKSSVKSFISSKQMQRAQRKMSKLEKDRSLLETSLSEIVENQESNDMVAVLSIKLFELEEEVTKLRKVKNPTQELLDEVARLEEEKVVIGKRIQECTDVEQSLRLAADSIDELVEEESFTLESITSHGEETTGCVSPLYEIMKKHLKNHAVFTPEEKDPLILALLQLVANLEKGKLRQKQRTAKLQLDIKNEQVKNEQVQARVRRLELDTATRSQSVTSTMATQTTTGHSSTPTQTCPTLGKKKLLDEEYISSLEKDIKYYKRTISELKEKAGFYFKKMNGLKVEHENMKQFLVARAEKRKKKKKKNDTPVPVKVSRRELEEIVLN